eukprot:COSAG02_NODE_1123_length_14441_cov_28.984521_9_plen_74_part_00
MPVIKARKLSARAIEAYQPTREFDVGVGSDITNVPVQAKGGVAPWCWCEQVQSNAQLTLRVRRMAYLAAILII